MDSRKNRGISKIFPCFRPDDVDHDDADGRAFVMRNGKPPLGSRKTINLSDESFLSSSLSSDDTDSSVDGGGGGSGRSSKGSSRRRFSRAIKAVFFDTSLSRKIRERKYRKNSFDSSASVKSNKTEHPINYKSSSFEESLEADEMNRINSSRSSIFSSSANGSSSLSSSCASSRNGESTARRGSFRTLENNASFRATNPVELKESSRGFKSLEARKLNTAEEKKIDQYYSSTVGVCLLLVSLLVLVFWGKICAIFCTSVWLFFGPRRIKGSLESPVKLASSVNVDSEKYKKRVIMEGLLERNHNWVAAQ